MFAKYLDFVVSVSGTPNTSILVDYHTQESFRSSWSRMSVCKYDINEIILLKNLSFQNSAQKKKLRDFHLQDSGGTRFCTKSKIMRPPLMQRRWCKIVTNSMDDFQKKNHFPPLYWRDDFFFRNKLKPIVEREWQVISPEKIWEAFLKRKKPLYTVLFTFHFDGFSGVSFKKATKQSTHSPCLLSKYWSPGNHYFVKKKVSIL